MPSGPLVEAEEEPPVSQNTVGVRPCVRGRGLREPELLVKLDGRPDVGRLQADLVEVSEHSDRRAARRPGGASAELHGCPTLTMSCNEL